MRALLLGLVSVAACATLPPAAETPAEDACGASAHRGMIGVNIAAATFPAGVRVIGPDTAVTRDFRRERLNVLIDANGVITGFACY